MLWCCVRAEEHDRYSLKVGKPACCFVVFVYFFIILFCLGFGYEKKRSCILENLEVPCVGCTNITIHTEE